MELNKRIERLLNAKNGGNMSELARHCDVTPQAVQQWIEGHTAPRGKRLSRIAEFFEITEAELVYGGPETLLPTHEGASDEAMEIARAYDRLGSPDQKRVIRMQLIAFGALPKHYR